MRLSAPIYQLKRRAKRLARDAKIALHEALDRVARQEGFAAWSQLAFQSAANSPPKEILSRLANGDLLLLGARPGHGKTSLSLQLLLAAVSEGRRAIFFTLEYSEQETRERIRSLDSNAQRLGDGLEIVTSDDISADYIIRHLSGSAPGTVAVIDYLQILDQKRSKPALFDQMLALREFARNAGVVLAFISQIDRTFDPASKRLPDIGDIRLPNFVDLKLFTKACFLHDQEARLRDVA